MDKIRPELIRCNTELEVREKVEYYSSKRYIYSDLFPDQAKELVELRSIVTKEEPSQLFKEYSLKTFGTIVVYHYKKIVLRILEENDFYTLLTSRNKNLINIQEQDKLRRARLSIAGLSVGSNIAIAVAMQGGCSVIKLADNDKISTSNMNRILTDLFSVGENKCESLAKRLYEINPFLNIELYPEGIDDDNIDGFIYESDIVFDEVDSLNLKLDLRLKAKNNRVPLIMITDNGDNIMVDVERYDLQPELDYFHGLLSKSDIEILSKSKDKYMSPKERAVLSLKIVQPQNAVKPMQDSLLEVGKTLKTWPQLATAALLAGVVGSYIIRKVVTGQPLNTGRLHVSIDSVFVPSYLSEEKIAEREHDTQEFLRKIGN